MVPSNYFEKKVKMKRNALGYGSSKAGEQTSSQDVFQITQLLHIYIYIYIYIYERERERASRSALTKYKMKSLVYVRTTNIYLEYIGYMFRPVNRPSSGHQSNKSKVLLRYWDPNICNYIQYKIWY